MKLLGMVAAVVLGAGCGRVAPVASADSTPTAGAPTATISALASPSDASSASPSTIATPIASPTLAPPQPPAQPAPCEQLVLESFTGQPGSAPRTVTLSWAFSGGNCSPLNGTLNGQL